MATRRSRTYRRETLEVEPSRCHRCGRSASPDDLQAHHVQELQDNGPNNWTVMVCKPCHRILTREARQVRNAAKPTGGKKAPPGAATRVRPSWDSTIRLTMLVTVLGAFGWAAGYEREVVAAGIGWVALNVPVAWWRIRRARRQTVIRGLTDMLARATNTLHGNMRVRVRRWDARRPVEGSATYTWIFDDSPTSAARAGIEESLARKIGRRLVFTWHTDENIIAWEPDNGTAAPAKANPQRAKAAARVRRGIEAELGPLDDFQITAWVDNRIHSFTGRYPTTARVHTDRVQDAVEDKVHSMLGRAWRAVWDLENDTFTFTDTPDPLAEVVPAGPPQTQVDLGALPVGRCEDGTPWRVPLVTSSGPVHTFIAGVSGSGKGSVIWALVDALTPAIVSGHVVMWGIDPKNGMELGRGLGVWDRYAKTDPDGGLTSIANLMDEAVAYMREKGTRLAAAGNRNHVPTPEDPLMVLVIDEIANLTKRPERKMAERLNNSLGLLLEQARATGVCVIGAVQDPRKETSPRDGFTARVLLRVAGKALVDLVLGDGARAAGGRADKISADTAGVGYYWRDGTPYPIRVRATWVPDDRIEQIARRISAARQARQRPSTGPTGPVWEPMYPRELADTPWREQTVWVRFDADGRTIEATVVGLVENPVDADETDLDWQATDGEVGSITLGRDEIVHVRQ